MATWQVQTTDGGTTRVDGVGPTSDVDGGVFIISGDDGETVFFAPLANLLYVKKVSDGVAP